MPSLADLIYEETKTLPEPQAREVLDFIGYLKQKVAMGTGDDVVDADTAADGDWSEFERLAGRWSGRFNREECYDRPLLR